MISELKARVALLENGWDVSLPALRESHDLEARNPQTGENVRIQVKTVYTRDDRKGELVVFARKSDGKAYSAEDCDYFIGVHGDDVYMFKNRGLTEYWRSEKPRKDCEWIPL